MLDLLNSTFQDALDQQEEQIDDLTEELELLKKRVIAQSDGSNSTLNKESYVQQGALQ